MEIGRRIKQLRKAAGFTQEELGNKLGVQKNAVSKWETRRVINIPYKTIQNLADIFCVSVPYLLTGEPSKTLPDNLISAAEMGKLPLYGTIACGETILADNMIEDYIDIPRHIKADFALTCQGDSMINARIFDGDIVYIRKQDSVDNGDIAAVLVDHEATFKRFYRYPDHIILESENPMYRPKKYWDEDMEKIRILGKAVAFCAPVK